jgi:hypothetical protein
MIVLVSCDSCCFSKKYRFLFSDKFDFAGDVNKFDFVGGSIRQVVCVDVVGSR